MPGARLRLELVRRIDRRIQVASQPLLRFGQRVGHILERDVPNDEQIDVAVSSQLPAGCRAEHEGDDYTVSDGRQRLPQDVGRTRGLEEERLELWKDRRLTVHLEVHLSPLDGAPDEPGAGEQVELPLDSTLPGPGTAHDLAQVIRLAGMPQQPAQHTSSGTAEQLGRGFAGACRRLSPRTHFEYDRTH